MCQQTNVLLSWALTAQWGHLTTWQVSGQQAAILNSINTYTSATVPYQCFDFDVKPEVVNHYPGRKICWWMDQCCWHNNRDLARCGNRKATDRQSWSGPLAWKNTSIQEYIDGSMQDCSISSALAMEILQPCPKSSIYHNVSINISLMAIVSYFLVTPLWNAPPPPPVMY